MNITQKYYFKLCQNQMIESKTVECWEKRFLCKWSHFRISINVQQCQYLINKIFITNQKTENNNIKVILYLPTMPWHFKSAHTFAISYFIWCITIINVSIILYVLALCVCVCSRACVCVLVVFLIWTGWDCANITLRLLLGISFVLLLFRTDIIIIIIFTLLR